MLVALVTFCSVGFALAQPGAPAGPEYAVLKQDVGKWKAKCKMWMGPGDPIVSQATETVRMLGEHWAISDFHGSMMGQAFSGHGMFSYDAKTKKYIGSWADSMSPNLMHMTGTYDEATKTMTMEGMGAGPDGVLMKHKLITVYKSDDTKVFTMHGGPAEGGADQMTKMMEITYTRMKHDHHGHDHGSSKKAEQGSSSKKGSDSK